MRNVLLLLLISCFAQGQALRDINFKYLYDGSTPFSVHIKSVPDRADVLGFLSVTLKDTTDDLSNYLVTLEKRTDLLDKGGVQISSDSISIIRRTRSSLSGETRIRNASKSVLVARIVHKTAQRAWFFYTEINPNAPQHSYISAGGMPVLKRFVKTNTEIQVSPAAPQTISFYSDDFPAGTPIFSESIARVSKGFVADTVFNLDAGANFVPPARGLYLIQSDTTAEKGIAFRAENDYPRYSKVESLADPLIYICTRQEFEKIKKAKGDKPAFDRVILAITGERERAKIFMKTYFRRVELANEFFSSYKEGWKTDRGMIYLIFGPPDEVFRFFDREVWKYNNIYNKVSFDFAKSATIFDPENFVLIREGKYQEMWYEAIDLRRNGQF